MLKGRESFPPGNSSGHNPTPTARQIFGDGGGAIVRQVERSRHGLGRDCRLARLGRQTVRASRSEIFLMMFLDRADAGRFLASQLQQFANRRDVLVLALPRGGVPVGYEIGRALRVPLEVFIVRKLGVPGQEELAMGAIASGGTRVLNADVIAALGAGAAEAIERTTALELEELRSREKRYRDGRPFPDLRGKTIILVDDGLATGATMRAAARAVRELNPARVIIAVPVAAKSSCRDLAGEADELICGHTPSNFFGVGQSYHDFRQTSDMEVRQLLARAAAELREEQPND